jgi:hypothetical protein
MIELSGGNPSGLLNFVSRGFTKPDQGTRRKRHPQTTIILLEVEPVCTFCDEILLRSFPRL